MYQEMLDRLLEGRARATGELQRFYKEAEKRGDEHGRLTGEDQAEWEKRSADLDDFDSRIKDLKDKIHGERQADEFRAGAEKFIRPEGMKDEDGGSDWAAQEKRLFDFFTGKPGDGKPDQIEISLRGLTTERVNDRNIVRESRSLNPVGSPVESRAGLSDGTGVGAELFGPSFRSILYQHLLFHSAIRQTRATVITTGGGENLLLPKTTAHPAAGTIVSEASAIGESDPTFGQGTLGAFKYGNIVLVSSELEQDTQVDLLGYLAKIMGQRLGDGMGAHFVTGTGSSQPQGVLAGAGTIAQVTGGTPAASGATFNELTQLYDKIIPPYQVNAEWFLGQSAMQKIRALVNSQGTPIFLPSLYGSQPDTLFGKPIVMDPNVPAPATNATSIAFGDFSAYFIRDVAGLRFERSIDYAFNTDQVAYRALWRADGRLLDLTGAIGVYKGGTA